MNFSPYKWEIWTVRKLVNKGDSPFLDKIMTTLSNPYQWIAPMIILVIYLLLIDVRGAITALILGGISAGLADSINFYVLKKRIIRIRPQYFLDDIKGIGAMNSGKRSFPSNHASNTIAITLMLFFFFPHVLIPGAIAVFLVGYSRIYCGAHYPLDVLFGWLHGVFWAGNIYMFYRIIIELI
jgi:undecaprenyl-diphosphatase